MRIALAQMNVKRGEFRENLSRAGEMARAARAGGAQLAVFPEMFASGFDYKKNAEFLESSPRAIEVEMSRIARENSIAAAGSVPHICAGGGLPRNRLCLMGPDGAEIAHYDKIHLFGMFREDRHVGAGRETVVADTPFGKIGFAVCYDLRFPELFIRLARAGAKLAVICAVFPHPRSEHWRVLCRARAIENQFFVAAVNQCGEERLPGGTAKYCGLSAVFDPWGEIVAECPPDAEALAFADIDLSEADEIRSKMPVLSDRVLI